ncbi:MAG: methionine adenosyltransferase [Rhizobacter sp.]|nr:methionine adenosyltransferase [Chlorobiales bacterium]
MSKHFFTSESVSEGHPDKVADQISDTILDAILEQDSESRVACESFVTTGQVVVGGEITTEAYIEVPDLVRKIITDIGYTKGEYMFEAKSCGVLSAIHAQSPDINRGVDKKKARGKASLDQGAGDQGMMFGYACKETPELMPAAITYAHQLVKRLADVRKQGKEMTYLRPDAKSQVTLEYDGNEIIRIDAIVVSTQHDPEPKGVSESQWQKKINDDVMACIVDKVIPKKMLDGKTKFFVNPTGRFEIGGPHGDTGLTGRKIIVDTYGGAAPHGGGAFSGKDPSKVDRSAAYAARHIAKNVVGAGLADKCTVQVSYAIGIAQPTSIRVETHGTGFKGISDAEVEEKVKRIFDMRPRAITERFRLTKPKGWKYVDTAAYGHFGRDIFPWEKLDKVNELMRAFK